jgi:hypothetical protein
MQIHLYYDIRFFLIKFLFHSSKDQNDETNFENFGK